MINLVEVTAKEQKSQVKFIIENYHSYVPTNASVGRRIDWLVYHEDEIVGMIGVGSSVYPPPKDLLRYLGLSKEEEVVQDILQIITVFSARVNGLRTYSNKMVS